MTVKIPSKFVTFDRPRFTPKGRSVDAALAKELGAERRVVIANLLRALGDASAEEVDTTEIDGCEISGRAAIEILALRDMVEWQQQQRGFLEQALAELAQRDGASEAIWRPIATAPLDKRILAYSYNTSGGRVYIAWWDGQAGRYEEDAKGPRWRDDHADDCEPTHWMPLPEIHRVGRHPARREQFAKLLEQTMAKIADDIRPRYVHSGPTAGDLEVASWAPRFSRGAAVVVDFRDAPRRGVALASAEIVDGPTPAIRGMECGWNVKLCDGRETWVEDSKIYEPAAAAEIVRSIARRP